MSDSHQQGPDARALIHGMIEAIFQQKASGRTWGKITLEVTFQGGRPFMGKVTDETSMKFETPGSDSEK